MYLEKKTIISAFIAAILFCGYSFNDEISLNNADKGIFILKIDTSNNLYNVSPYISKSLERVESVAQKVNAIAAINAGYFDPKNEKTISYVIKDGKIKLDPTKNKNLTQNIELKPHLPKILNRAEFRVLKCKDQTKYDITYHYETQPKGCSILHSIQAGPMLYPKMELEKEFFTLTKKRKIIRTSAGIFNKYPRSAIGLKDNQIFIVATSQDKKINIRELQNIFKKLKVDKAMAFDGGSSTSLYFNDGNKKTVINPSSSSRKVKSLLVITKK